MHSNQEYLAYIFYVNVSATAFFCALEMQRGNTNRLLFYKTKCILGKLIFVSDTLHPRPEPDNFLPFCEMVVWP